MRACRRRLRAIGLAAGGELAGWRQLRLGRHLRSCAGCSRALAELQAARSALRALPPPRLAENELATIRAAVLKRVAVTGRPQRLSLWPRPGVAFAAAALTAAAAALWLWPARSPLPPPAGQPTATGWPVPGEAPPPAAAAAAPPRPAAAAPAPSPAAEVAAAAAPPPRAIPPAAGARALPAPPPLLVKLISDQRDIVIYWLVEPQEEEHEAPEEISSV